MCRMFLAYATFLNHNFILLRELVGYFCMFVIIYVKNRDCSAHMKMPLTYIVFGERKLGKGAKIRNR